MTRKKTIIEFSHIKNNKYNIKVSGDVKKISGRRFVKLLGFKRGSEKEAILNRDLILDFYGVLSVKPSKRLELGEKMEQYMIDYFYKKEPYVLYDYNTLKGDGFCDGTEDIYDGLPDALIPTLNTMLECKTTNKRINGAKTKWKKQLQFYANRHNTKLVDMGEPSVDKLEIIIYYIKDLDWQYDNEGVIIPEYIQKVEIPLDTEQIEKDLITAQEKLKDILKQNEFIISTKRCNYLWNGIIECKKTRDVMLKYDKNDLQLVEKLKEIKII
ncbi:MAG: hypothetical protein JXR51_12625 [Bacteroidales bacterium]|nr:hypothetical protein [Bacteroidales bacterium]